MRLRLLKAFSLLYAGYGPRHWWPAESPTEVMVGAVLTQSVSWANVERAIQALKTADLLDFERIHAADVAVLQELIRPALYFRTKARKLKALASLVREGFGGDLDRMFATPAQRLRELLLGVWGIGPETADAIILYAARQPVLVVDAYTTRVLIRLGILDGGRTWTYDEVQDRLAALVPRDVAFYNEFHALIDRLGSTTCRKNNPRCEACPLRADCTWPRTGNVEGVSSHERG